MKFTIRDLFLVTVIVALILGWWGDRSSLSRKAEHDAEHAGETQSTTELLATELNEHGYHLTVHSDGTVSGTHRFRSLPQSLDPFAIPSKN